MAVANPGAQLQKPTANQQINNAMNQPAPVTQNDLNTLLGNAVTGAKQTSAKLFNNQAKQTAQTSQEAMGNAYNVNANGQAPAGLKAGDTVNTKNGQATVASVNPDGTYQMKPTGDTVSPDFRNLMNQVVGGVKQAAKTVVTNHEQTVAQQAQQAQQNQQQKQNNLVPTYNKNIDYGDEAAKAYATGDPVAAAAFELLRNMKIDGEGMGSGMKTEQFKDWWSQVTPDMLMRLANGYVSGVTKANPADAIRQRYEQFYAQQPEWVKQQVDYATDQAVTGYQRALEDAQPEFQRQLNLNDINTARAMSNSALYAEARGDRGGIGQSQYNEIQAAAMKNRQAIESARTKLATDYARAIIDAQKEGDFKKAQMLNDLYKEAADTYATWLMNGAEWDLKMDDIIYQREQDERNFQLNVANTITGTYNGKPTLSQQNAQREFNAAAGELALKYGQMPTPEQLAAMGITESQAQGIIWQMQMENFNSGGSSGGGGSSRSSGSKKGSEPSEPADGGGGGGGTSTAGAVGGLAPAIIMLNNLTSGATGSGKSGSTGSSGSGNGGNKNTEQTYINKVNAAINGGASQKEVEALINQYLRAGYISKDTADKLRLTASRGSK